MGLDLYGPHYVTGDSAVAALVRTLNQLVENMLAGATPATGSVTDAKVAEDAAIAQSKIAGLVADLATKLNAAGIVAKAAATTNSDLSGLDVIDGYQTVAGDQVLLTAQTTPSENGPWIVAAGAWSRPADFGTGSVHAGRAIVVSGGTLAGSVWTLNTTAPVTVGTTAQTWVNAPVRSGTYAETPDGQPAVALLTRGASLDHKLGANADEPGAFVAWTADDGYRAQAGFFSLLNSKGIDGTLFLTQLWVDKAGTNGSWNDTYITTAQVQAIAAAGHELATHGVNHEDHAAYLTANGVAAFVSFFAGAKTYIESTFGVEVKTGAYPAGISNARVRELMARIGHEFYRGTKGMVSRGPTHPLDVPAVDVYALSEEAIKAHIDTAVANRSVAVFLLHGWPPAEDAAIATKIGNCIDYATSLGVPQGTFYEAMSQRTQWRSTGAFVDTQGRAFHPHVRAYRLEFSRDDAGSEHIFMDIDETTNAGYLDQVGFTTFEFRKPIITKSTFTAAGGINGCVVQPAAAVAESTVLLTALRSAAEATNPGTAVFAVQQSGHVTVGGSVAGNATIRDAAGTALVNWLANGKTWQAAGTGGVMIIDSGTGGSNIEYKGFRHRFWDHAGARKIALATALPTDASLNAGEMAIWFDPTNGAAKLMVKAKQTDGTVRTGSLALA